ncbi:hypothetical protein HY732_00355 [Candidatus Uhrbacteria bacterium]|nr:hypothetical protein [Candidatus Uhrbacteria bacterium]
MALEPDSLPQRSLGEIAYAALERYNGLITERVMPLFIEGKPQSPDTTLAMIAVFEESLPPDTAERKILLDACAQNSSSVPGGLIGAYTAWEISQRAKREDAKEHDA